MSLPRATLALDTSVVIRLLMQQPVALYDRAAVFLEAQLLAGANIVVPDEVLAETYYALQSFYQMPKDRALKSLAALGSGQGISLSPVAQAVLSLPNLASAKPGFVDRLIHGAAHANGQTLVTFEQSARKLSRTIVLPGT